jgi:putative GTP pyrophosphokinase
MSDRETDLRERWLRERPMYDAWGSHVAEVLSNAIAREIEPVSVDLFFRIPVKHRTKEESSLLAKAFHRGKSYVDPYADIEDKVGIRVVVLFSEEIRVVERAILSCGDWVAEKARDFEEERERKPFEFDYQSLHYVIRSSRDMNYGEIGVVSNTPCEIQVRTILQHAYSELTHDTIYKPSVQAEPAVKRAAAKSMALIEATDDYFMQVRERLNLAQAPGRQVAATTESYYRELTGLEPDVSPLNALIVDHFKKWAQEDFDIKLDSFVREKSFLSDYIKERAPTQLLYRQPAVLLAYWAISQAPRAAPIDAPLSNDELGPLYGDLGIRLPEARM